MIFIDRSKIIITTDYPNYNFLRRYLIKIYEEKNVNYFTYIRTANEKTKYNLPEIDKLIDTMNNKLRQSKYDKFNNFYKAFYLYELDEQDNLIIPIGYLDFIKPYIIPTYTKFTYNLEDPLVDTKSVLKKINEKLLPNITLRKQQINAIEIALKLKRTIIQMATGVGKSEVMCGIVESLRQELDYIPTTLILEPTDKLKKEMIERFNKYNLDAIDYNKNRKIIENKINIAHPASLNNDLKINNNLLNNVKVYFTDECHHLQSSSWNIVTMNLPNAEYLIGVSASAVSQEHLNGKAPNDFSLEELKSIAMMGFVSYNVTAKEMINEGKLAEPTLLIVNNLANEKLPKRKESDWHSISKIRLQSETRTKQIAKCASFFTKKRMKTLILINNKEWAYNICRAIYDYGYGEQCRLSFGGQIFLRYDNNTNEFIKDKETFNKFKEGEVSILIGTQHLIEGVDVPSLDCVILPAIGKSERIQIQSCGRVLRLTKNGNRAYIIDFSDEKDPILAYQFKTRLSTYINTIGIKPEDIHILDRNNLDNSLEQIYNKYESI